MVGQAVEQSCRLTLDLGTHRQLVHREHDLGGHRSQALDGFGDVVPPLGREAVALEGGEDVDEEADELARDVARAGAHRFGLLAGALCGTVGFAAEYGWTQLTSPQPWTAAFLPEAIPTALAAGLAGGALGALLGMALVGRLPSRPVRRRVALGATAVMIVLGANALVLDEPAGVRAEVALEPVASNDGRTAYLTARISPAAAARDTNWFNAVAWQGGGRRTAAMRPIGDGRFRSSEPLPLYGEWKTALRIQKDRGMIALPLHLPRDTGVPTPGVTRPDRFTATFVPDTHVLQTERRDYVVRATADGQSVLGASGSRRRARRGALVPRADLPGAGE